MADVQLTFQFLLPSQVEFRLFILKTDMEAASLVDWTLMENDLMISWFSHQGAANIYFDGVLD